MLGVGIFIVFPTLGLIEALAGIWVLTTHRASSSVVAVLSSVVVLAYAVQAMFRKQSGRLPDLVAYCNRCDDDRAATPMRASRDQSRRRAPSRALMATAADSPTKSIR